MGINIRRECRACGYSWTATVLPMKGGKVVVMDRPISVPTCPACPEEG